jgi:hypothetical protein
MSDSEVASAWLGGMVGVSLQEASDLQEKLDLEELPREIGGMEWRVFGDFVTGDFFAVGIFPAGGIQDFIIGGLEPMKLEGKTIPQLPTLDSAGIHSVAEALGLSANRVALGFHSAVSVY